MQHRLTGELEDHAADTGDDADRRRKEEPLRRGLQFESGEQLAKAVRPFHTARPPVSIHRVKTIRSVTIAESAVKAFSCPSRAPLSPLPRGELVELEKGRV